MKIAITGGIGYIGTELCKLYSKESRKHHITVIDNRFIPFSVAMLKKTGIKFAQCDILDREALSKAMGDADLVYHLAGITDVPRTTSEADKAKEALIERVGTEGSRNVIASMKKGAKIVFPSSHIVFEGVTEQAFDLKEDHPTKTILSYSRTKETTEKDLAASDKNYAVLRLGSNYGLGGPTMRMDIMPNIFARIASQNGTLKLFGGGVQYKPLIDVRDTARCMKHVGEAKEISRETFHAVGENMTVADVANICKKLNPHVNLQSTSDEIPNKGYTLSNEKLLSTGFKFKHTIKDSLKEMIDSWKST